MGRRLIVKTLATHFSSFSKGIVGCTVAIAVCWCNFANAVTTSAELYDSCDNLITMLETWQLAGQSPSMDAGHCMGFIDGTLETHNVYARFGTAAVTCVPGHVQRVELATIFVEYIRKYPDKLRDAAAPNLLLALMEIYPCDSEPGATLIPQASGLEKLTGSLPRVAGNLVRGESVNNESEHPGLGMTVFYDAQNAKGTVYAYKLDLDAVPEGIESNEFKHHYADTVNELGEVSSSRKITLVREFVHLTPHSKIRLQCSQFSIALSDGPLDTLLCLTGHLDHFLKIRYTEKSGSRVNRNFEDFVDGIISSLSG